MKATCFPPLLLVFVVLALSPRARGQEPAYDPSTGIEADYLRFKKRPLTEELLEISAGNTKNRLARARRGLLSNPYAASLHFQAALAYGVLREFDKEQAELRRAIELDPEEAEFHLYLAERALTFGNQGDAREAAQAAVRVDERNPYTRCLLARILQLEGETEPASTKYQQCARLMKDLKNSYIRREEQILLPLRTIPTFWTIPFLYREEHSPCAVRGPREGIAHPRIVLSSRIFGYRTEVGGLEAFARAQIQNLKDGKASVDQTETPQTSVAYEDPRWSQCPSPAQLQAVLENAQAVLASGKNPVRAYWYLQAAWSLKQMKKYQEALQEIEQSIQNEPHYISAYLTGAEIARSTKDVQKQMNYLERALALDPNDPRTRFFLGEALRKKDRAAAALHYEHSLRVLNSHVHLGNYIGVERRPIQVGKLTPVAEGRRIKIKM